MPSPTDVTAIDIPGEAALDRFTARLATALPVPATIALHGDLGAGKTRFVKGLAAAAGLEPDGVVSPTFGLVHVLPLPDGCRARRLVHADLHRLAGPGDLAEIGWDELTAGPTWVCVEWADRAGHALPADRLDVAIDIVSESARRLLIRAGGPRHAAALAALVRPQG
jgi:tRNA threonylcarbamoyl adenosine modification protein YjeE